ncbi:hypothetical protein [Arthrobacter sp. SIMBA_036]
MADNGSWSIGDDHIAETAKRAGTAEHANVRIVLTARRVRRE